MARMIVTGCFHKHSQKDEDYYNLLSALLGAITKMIPGSQMGEIDIPPVNRCQMVPFDIDVLVPDGYDVGGLANCISRGITAKPDQWGIFYSLELHCGGQKWPLIRPTG